MHRSDYGREVFLYGPIRDFFNLYKKGVPTDVSERLMKALESGNVSEMSEFFIGHLHKLKEKNTELLYNSDMNPGEKVHWKQDIWHETNSDTNGYVCYTSRIITNQRIIVAYTDEECKRTIRRAMYISELSVRANEVEGTKKKVHGGFFYGPAWIGDKPSDIPSGTVVFCPKDPDGSSHSSKMILVRSRDRDDLIFDNVDYPNRVARLVKRLAAPPKRPREPRATKRSRARSQNPNDKTR